MPLDQSQYIHAMAEDPETGKPMQKVAVSQAGGTVKDYWSGAANITKNFASARNSLLIANDGATDLTVAVNGMNFTVKSQEIFDEKFDPFTSVQITTTSAYRAWARG